MIFYFVNRIKNHTIATYLFVFPISIISTYLYSTFPENINPIYGYYWPTNYICRYALGYFLYENIINLTTQTSLSIKLHGLICLTVYLLGYYIQLFSKYGIFYLTFEVSTIFLNKAKTSNNYLYQFMFVLTFFIFRIVLGTIVTYDFILKTSHELSWNMENNPTLYYVYCVLIIMSMSFMALNYYWFCKIMKRVIDLFIPKNK